jgi:hypothetical protein
MNYHRLRQVVGKAEIETAKRDLHRIVFGRWMVQNPRAGAVHPLEKDEYKGSVAKIDESRCGSDYGSVR